mmetsp:Transcript_10748/g.17086  ORF Transcript_10748/g.17086 Transcript_10748/m.17086 type:complete len:222 (+) Transcript_10748:593-1258(+)
MCGMTLKGSGWAKTSFTTGSLLRPFLVPASNSIMPAAPAPLAAWYVDMMTFRKVNFWCSGQSAIAAMAVVQFGLAIRSFPLMAAGFTSGTTSGMSSSYRKALELSMTTVLPLAMICGENSLLKSPDTAISTKSHACAASTENSSTSISPKAVWIFLPADRSEASRTNLDSGNLRSWRTCTISSPTAPVAPTTATIEAMLMNLFAGQTGQLRPAPRAYNLIP